MSPICTMACLAAIVLLRPLQLSAQAPTPAAIRTEIQQAVRAYVDASNRADAGTLAEMYTREPGVTSVGDGAITRGWDAIRTETDSIMGLEGRFRLSVGSIDVTTLGPGFALAVAGYTLTLRTDQGDVQLRGVMTLVFKRIDTEWKIIHDHTSTQTPPAGQPPGGAAAAPTRPARQPAAPARPTAIPVADVASAQIEAGGFIEYPFNLPAAVCTLTGRVVGTAGGSRDFEAFLFDDIGLLNWRNGQQASAYWQSGRAAAASISAQLQGPGTLHLVVSNVFSLLTPKAVQVQAEARC